VNALEAAIFMHPGNNKAPSNGCRHFDAAVWEKFSSSIKRKDKIDQ
jgi:hypothetical protein